MYYLRPVSSSSLDAWLLANVLLVSEPIALKLRQTNGDTYLHAQIFTGFMYVASAISMWLLRAWKIGEIERIAASQEKTPAEVDARSSEPGEASLIARSGSRIVKSSIVKRLFAWKRV